MHREQRATVFHRAFKALGLILGIPSQPALLQGHLRPRLPYARERRHDGPAAINGRHPELQASLCREQSHCPADYSTGGRTAAVPSGALVLFSCAKARVLSSSGSSTEISEFLKPAANKWSTAFSARPGVA